MEPPGPPAERYRPRQILGEGGAARVWLVEDRLQPGRPVALKELATASGQPLSHEERLRREYAILACLKHPNIVEVHEFDSGPAGAAARFTLEFIRGRDIVSAVACEGGGILLDLAVEALRALGFLHDLGLIHRDLKPGNVLVRDRPKLGRRLVFVDFGLALLATGEKEGTAVGPAGTLPYLAPETLSDAAASVRSDLYSLGAVLHEAATGEPLYRPGRDLSELLERIREGRRARPPLRAGIPDGFRDWLEQLLSPDARARPASAEEALARLNASCGTSYPLDDPVERAARLASGPPAEREEDAARLWAEIEKDPGAFVLWLVGPEGSGKSRLLRWVEARTILAGRQARLLRAAEATASELRGIEEASKRASSRPTLLLLDDVERAAEPVCSFLSRLVQGGNPPAVQVIAAVQAAAGIRRPSLRALYGQTGLLAGLRRVELAPLGRNGIAAMARRALRGGVSDARLDWLLEASEGSPARAEALLIEGSWERGRPAREAGARGEALRGRTAMLSAEAKAWLEALALLEADLGEDHLARLAGIAPATAKEAAEEAAVAGLARKEAGRWRLESRALAAEIRSEIPSDRRAAWSRRAAELLVSFSGAVEDRAYRLWRLWLDAGEIERAREAILAAAAESLGAGDPAEAAHRFGRALALMDREDPSRYEVRIRQAEALARAGQFPAACRAYGAALRLARDRARKVPALLGQAHALVQAGRFLRALAVAENAASVASELGDRHSAARAEQLLGIVLARLGREEEAVGRLEPVLRQLRALGDERLEADVLLTLGAAKLRLEREDAEADYERALELLSRLEPPCSASPTAQQLKARIGLAVLRERKGRYEEAESLLEDVRATASRQGALDLEEAAISRLALVAIDRGRFDRAMELARQAADLALRLGEPNLHFVARCRLADAQIRCGRAAAAAAVLRDALGGPLGQVEPDNTDYARTLLAEALVESGAAESEEAREAVRSALSGFRKRRKRRALLLVLSVEMERRAAAPAAGPLEPIEEEIERSRGEMEREADLEVRIRLHLARGRAALSRARSEEAIEAALAAEKEARGGQAPAFEAAALAVLAEAAKRVGDERAAAEARQRGRRLLEEAASRIEDPEARSDFLARPAYAPLREEATSAADTARLLVLYDMIRVLNSTTDPDRLLESILDMALRAVGAERGMILLREPDRGQGGEEFSVRLVRNLEQATVEDAESYSRTIVAQAGAGRSLLAVDAGADPRFRNLASVSLFGIRSLMCVPLRSRGKIVGTVYLDRRQGGRLFGPEDLRFVEAFADHAALALENARTRVELEAENRRLLEAARTRTEFGKMVGRSPAMQRVFSLIERYADSHLPVLIVGESGTGKELVARAIHDHGPRRDRPFLGENCAAVPEGLLETELFGHVRGAFTGAERDRPGLFELAHGGTLFLDEVGDMPQAMQARLLRVLEDGEVRRVGGEKTRKVDVRVLAATHRDLDAEVRAGRFRLDLLYRLRVLLIELPPLRERPGDIPLLVARFLEEASRENGRPAPAVTPEALALFVRYSWPGNVRELESAVRRLALLCGGEPITAELIGSDPALARTLGAGGRRAEPAISLAAGEREQLEKALAATEGNRAAAARLLGISRATMYRKLRRHGL
jgi:transcriptional regulator with GAF, ATPase, and Fis domain